MATANRVVRRNSGNSQLNTTDSAHVPMDATYDFSSDVHMNLNLPALDDYFSASVLVDLPHSLGDDSILLTPQPQQQQHLHQQKHQQQHQFQHAHQGQNQVPSLSTSPTPSICACQQSILAKLSELSLASAGSSHVMPFDRALSANRSIVALCTSTLECSPCARGNDVMLLLTLAALLAHVLGVFDSLVRARRETLHSRDTDQGRGAEPHMYGTMHLPTPSGTSTREIIEGGDTQSHVRLSLGSYELDARDEQILQTNLFKIELGKITALIEAFEGRLSRLSVGTNETKLHQDIVVYLKQGLRTNVEALKRLAHASGCMDM